MITRAGVVVTGSGAGLLGAGLLADYPEVIMLGLACVAALVTAALWMLARPDLVAVRQISPDRVREGISARAVLTVTNAGRLRSAPGLVIESVAGRRVTVPLPSLAAGRVFESVYALPTGRRGRYAIPALTVGHTDPLRLWQVERTHGADSVLYVHPKMHHIVPMPLGGPRDVEGPTSATAPQGGVAFHSLRDYQPGDDRRRIHWKSTARTGNLMVQENVVPDEPRHLVVLDTSESLYDDDSFEDAVRVAASVCAAAGGAGYPVGCRTTGYEPDRTWDDRASFALDVLAGARRSHGDRGLHALTDLLRGVVTPGEGAMLTVVTGRAAPEGAELVRAARTEFAAACLVHIGPTTGTSSALVSGVFTLDASTSMEFAVRWNQLFALWADGNRGR